MENFDLGCRGEFLWPEVKYRFHASLPYDVFPHPSRDQTFLCSSHILHYWHSAKCEMNTDSYDMTISRLICHSAVIAEEEGRQTVMDQNFIRLFKTLFCQILLFQMKISPESHIC